MKYQNTKQLLQTKRGKLFGLLPTLLFTIMIASSGISLAQTKVDIDAFKARSQKTVVKLEGMGEDITSVTWTDPNGVTLEEWQDPEGKTIPRQLESSYLFLVSGPGGHFLRKAWLSTNGEVIEEERRVYDSENRLVVEGIVDPITGSFTHEYRHRYSPDKKTQFTTEFENGKQVGEETARMLEE